MANSTLSGHLTPGAETFTSPIDRKWLDLAVKLLVPVLLIILMAGAIKFGSLTDYARLLSRQTYTSLLPALAAVYILAVLLFQLIRTVLWACYKPFPLSDGPLPSLTVIIPAYNEGPMVEKAIESVVESDYPKDRLEIICVDDGSTDRTWLYILRAWQRFPDLIKPIRFPENRGKKEGLYAGFTQGRGEVFVTIDSDSIIEKDALRHLVAPLLHDPQMGAVAGNVKVYNRHQSLMGKMQAVRFVNLDYLRASQSLYRTVVCTPGSLSAYRREALEPHLEAWRNQTFWGAPCPHSEDRALTNFIIRGGYYTYYQRPAVVYTLVPETYRGVCKMYLRWERGNVRESMVMLSFLFTRYRPRHRVMPIVELFLSQLEYPVTLLFFSLLVASALAYPPILFKFLTALGIMSLINLTYYIWLERDSEFVYGVVYAFYAFFLLQWIYPYAFVTVRHRGWLTR
ncbi:MAG: glycosyltransferase [Deltaproteobacteria bacterium]|nr:glycosyltransferase [Deltaproteobacteria bacterium]